MSRSRLVVHITPTPLVAAPAKLARLLDGVLGWRSLCLCLADYPKDLAGKFLGDAILWSGTDAEALAARALADASIVHVHNNLPQAVADQVSRLARDARFIYQVHSPLREGPLFMRRDDKIGLPFSARLVVAQYHARIYPDFRPVLNVVMHPGSTPAPLRRGERPRVLFSATHSRGGRWNGKLCAELDAALDALSRQSIIEAVRPGPMPPGALFELRRTCHISVDEIITGSYHQVSLEGFAAGTAVVNGADLFSIAMLREAACIEEDEDEVPFVRTSPATVYHDLLALVRDPERLVNMQQAAADFHRRYLHPAINARRLATLYEDILNA